MDVKSPENSTSKAAYQKEPKKVNKRFLNQQDRDSLAESADDAPNQTFVAGTSVAASKSAPESDPEEKEILLPVTLVSGSNRFRVNENFPPQYLDNEIKKTRPATSHTVGK